MTIKSDNMVKRRSRDCKHGKDCCKGGTHYYYTIEMEKFHDHIYSEDEVILMLGCIRDKKKRDRDMYRYNNRMLADGTEGQVFPYTDE